MTKRLREVFAEGDNEPADNLKKPADFYVRNIPLYNSDKIIQAIIMKCPWCGMEMASTGIHTIDLKVTRFRKILSIFGFPAGITITPKLACPYHPSHVFSITNGRIKAEK